VLLRSSDLDTAEERRLITRKKLGSIRGGLLVKVENLVVEEERRIYIGLKENFFFAKRQ